MNVSEPTPNTNSLKIIFFANINGEFTKFCEMFNKIKIKSGAFDLVFLTGNVFNAQKDFSLFKDLESLKTKIIIFDESEVGIVCKHTLIIEPYLLSENITILGRSGFYTFEGIRIAYLNGKENKKYLSEDNKYKYTSCFFSREDIDRVLEDTKLNLKTDILLVNSIPSIIYDEMIK